MYKNIRKIHLWFSVPLGLIMALICATGLILLFEPHYSTPTDRSEFFLNVMRLHRWLFDAPATKGAMTTGKMIVAISVCCMIVSIITGLILWYLRYRKNLSRGLRLTFNSGYKSFFKSLHITGGFYMAIFLLVMALTGLTWSFGWYRTIFMDIFSIAKGSHTIYEIHTGAFAGIISQIIWFFAAAIGCILPLTGYWMWLQRLRR